MVQTPQPNLVAGMAWLQSPYTIRLRHRHKLFGHVFSGRYQAQIVEGSGSGHLKTACDYVHLNPVRAGMLKAEERLLAYRWSSLGAYLVGSVHLGASKTANAKLHRHMRRGSANPPGQQQLQPGAGATGSS